MIKCAGTPVTYFNSNFVELCSIRALLHLQYFVHVRYVYLVYLRLDPVLLSAGMLPAVSQVFRFPF